MQNVRNFPSFSAQKRDISLMFFCFVLLLQSIELQICAIVKLFINCNTTNMPNMSYISKTNKFESFSCSFPDGQNQLKTLEFDDSFCIQSLMIVDWALTNRKIDKFRCKGWKKHQKCICYTIVTQNSIGERGMKDEKKN